MTQYRFEVIANSINSEILSIVLEVLYYSNTSVTYSYECPLKHEMSKESDFSLNIQLMDGNAFKFTGMERCYE